MRMTVKTRGPDLLSWQDRKRSRLGYYEVLPSPTEQQWHIDLVRTIRRYRLLSPGWRLQHIPSGGKRAEGSGAIMKAQGHEPGWPDLVLCRPIIETCPVGLPHGLELKRLGEKPSDLQIAIGDWFLANGWPWTWVDNIDAAWAVLRRWGAVRLIGGAS